MADVENEKATIKSILIVGGGSAGWMTAALFSHLFQGIYSIRLVESDEIGIIGVGEATIPAIKKFNELLELDEVEFLKTTQGSYKLGIEFVDWLRKGSSYIHGFGVIGQDWEWLRCHHYWLKLRAAGQADDFAAYSINTAACAPNKFMRAAPNMAESPLGHIAHAYHFDASLYAKFLRRYAEERGVVRTEGKVVDVALHPETGFVDAVTLESGEHIAADFFVDCSGFRALLIGQAMQCGYEDWSEWLPCDRAVAVPCERSTNFTPYTRSTARSAGWQWRIPLQHRTGNGHVYSSNHMSDDEAERLLLDNLDGAPRADPLKVKFATGKRHKVWHKNCLAVGLAAGFLEPLESTALFLIQSSVIRFIRLFPSNLADTANADEFNRQTDFEYERIRDFIILHYKATERDDSDFWNHVRTMEVPETLRRKWALWEANGRIFREDEELFGEESWIQVFLGQGVIPRQYDPLVDLKSVPQIAQYLGNIAQTIRKCVDVMPTHAEFVDKFCKSPPL